MGTRTRSARRPALSGALRRLTPERLSPGCLPVVLGTGILSIGAAQRGWDRFSAALIVLAAVGCAVLVVLDRWRLPAVFAWSVGVGVYVAGAARAGTTLASIGSRARVVRREIAR